MSKLNILVAIPYLDRPSLEFLGNQGQERIRFLLDSGAFTAWKKNEEFSLEHYCQALEKLPLKPWRYFTLDKIGDAKGTRENFLELLKRGYKPVPIFTRGESLDELEWYYDRSDLVGIGGLVGTSGNYGFVKGIMAKIGNRPVHWLGFTGSDFISYYRPYSCDSSSWAGALRYGKIQLYCGSGKWRVLFKKDFEKSPDPEIRRQFDLYGEDIYRLTKQGEWKNSGRGDCLLETITTKSWTRFQIELERQLGTMFFLACAGYMQIKLMSDAHAYWLAHPLYRVGSETPASRKASLRS